MFAITERQQYSDAYRNFINSIDSDYSRKMYQAIFPLFMKFCKVEPDNYDAMLTEIQPVKKLENTIRDYIIYLREDKKLAPATIALYTSCIAQYSSYKNKAKNLYIRDQK